MEPCMCGDPACGRCGNHGWAEQEAAEEWILETLYNAKLSPEEYKIVASVGLAAVHHARQASKITAAIIADNEAEARILPKWTPCPAVHNAGFCPNCGEWFD